MSKKSSIEARTDFYRKINDETQRALKKMIMLLDQHYLTNTKRRIPIPINMDLLAEYLVMQRLLELNLDAVHNKKDRWAEDRRREADICILSEKKSVLVEVKYSKYWKTDRPEYRWQFQNIDPTKFNYLVLVAEAEGNYRFFVFTKKEAMLYIPPVDWAWRPSTHKRYANRWVGIYENPDDWRKHIEEWMPRKPNPIGAKKKYMLSENRHVGYVATHLKDFEDKWNKIFNSVKHAKT